MIIERVSACLKDNGSYAFKNPHIVLNGSVNDDSADKLVKQLQDLCVSQVPLILLEINTTGGSCYAQSKILAALENCKIPIATYVTSTCMSAGIEIFLKGTKGMRYCSPQSIFMIHQAAGHGGFWTKTEEMAITAQQMHLCNVTMYAAVEKGCGMKPGTIVSLIQKNNGEDVFFRPKEAVAIGLCDHIGIPDLVLEHTLSAKIVTSDTILYAPIRPPHSLNIEKVIKEFSSTQDKNKVNGEVVFSPKKKNRRKRRRGGTRSSESESSSHPYPSHEVEIIEIKKTKSDVFRCKKMRRVNTNAHLKNAVVSEDVGSESE